MMDFLLTEADLKITNGDLAICSNDTDATAQRIRIRLKTLKGEWFMDSRLGIPYFSEILGQKQNERFLRQLILPEIESLSGIKAIDNFSIELTSQRALNIKFTAILSAGSTINIGETI